MKKCLLLISIFCLSVPALSQNLKLYVTLNPAGDFIAESNSVSGQATIDDKGMVEASNIKVPVKSLKTGISLRDEHMANKYLEAEKFPEILLRIAKGKEGKGQAILVVKGKSGKVAGTYEASGNKLKAVFNLKISDFGIQDISYKGIGVEDEAKVEVTLPLAKKAAGAAAAPAAAKAKK